jgi:hypothetical protein
MEPASSVVPKVFMKRRPHRKHRRAELDPVMSRILLMAAHPRRSALLAALCLALVWLVLTKSLPYAVAPLNPDAALFLNAHNPTALMRKAERSREQVTRQGKATDTSRPEGDAAADTIALLPKAISANLESAEGDQDLKRREIRGLALRAIATDPLNAAAFRILGEATSDPNQARALMQEAAKRSRREVRALFWLLNDSFYRKDGADALAKADLLMRTRSSLSAYVLRYLVLLAEDPQSRSLLVEELAKGPIWRKEFFEALARNLRRSNTPLEVMTLLKKSPAPCTVKEVTPYLDALIAKGAVQAAYNALLRLLPEEDAARLGLIMNANFERDPSGLPFDWRMSQGVNAMFDFVPSGAPGRRALHFAFGNGRVEFPETSQIVILPPSRYRLEGKLRGQMAGKRGLRWQLRCATGERRVLGETDMLTGQSEEWRVFSFEAEVPRGEACGAQSLRLFHDSRSASEEFFSGEAWFADIHVERIPDRLAAE